MKYLYSFFIISCLSVLYSPRIFSQQVNQLLEIPWNTEAGIKTQWDVTGNLGIQDFDMISENNVAIYASLEHKMKIYDIENKQLINEFPISELNCFTYDNINNLFYVVTYSNRIEVYCDKGTFIKRIPLHPKIGTPSVIRNENGNLFVKMHYTSYQIIKDNKILTPGEQLKNTIEGAVIGNGYFYSDSLIDNSTLMFKYSNQNGESGSVKIPTGETFASIEPLLIQNNNLFYDLCYIKTENNKNKFYHKIVQFSLTENKKLNELEVPRVAYLSMLNYIKEFDGKIYNLMTTPENAILFEIHSFENKSLGGYPKYLDYEYFYNEEIDKHIEKKTDVESEEKSTPPG